MKVRELLQKEIWSKRTSQRILRVIGIVGAVVGVVCVVGNGLDTYWMTPPERSAGRSALAEIDVLQNFRGMSDTDYDAGVKRAKAKVDAANQVAITSRDDAIASVLSGYLFLVNNERFNQKMDLRRNGRETEQPQQTTSVSLKMGRDYLRDVLHKALD